MVAHACTIGATSPFDAGDLTYASVSRFEPRYVLSSRAVNGTRARSPPPAKPHLVDLIRVGGQSGPPCTKHTPHHPTKNGVTP
jgi:hypothetical protein